MRTEQKVWRVEEFFFYFPNCHKRHSANALLCRVPLAWYSANALLWNTNGRHGLCTVTVCGVHVPLFAECYLVGTRWRGGLSSALSLALGKDYICWVYSFCQVFLIVHSVKGLFVRAWHHGATLDVCMEMLAGNNALFVSPECHRSRCVCLGP